jgi:hypothetical protein
MTTTKKITKPTYKKNDLYDYMIANADETIDKVKEMIGLTSTIEDDPEYFIKTKDRKSYKFYGGGCGFAWVDYDKRARKVHAFMQTDIPKKSIEKFRKFLATKIDLKVRNQMKRDGFPLEAMLFQDVHIQIELNHLVAEYIRETFNPAFIMVDYRYD